MISAIWTTLRRERSSRGRIRGLRARSSSLTWRISREEAKAPPRPTSTKTSARPNTPSHSSSTWSSSAIPPKKISILTTYNGQKDLILDILSQRCGQGTGPLAGVEPGAVSTVDQYQGQQNDYIILSLVRTKAVGHLRDVRRLIVAVSRARLGLYVCCRKDLFCSCHELRRTMDQFSDGPSNLQLVKGENFPTERMVGQDVPPVDRHEVEDVTQLGDLVHSMQREYVANQG